MSKDKNLIFLFATPCLQVDIKKYSWEELLAMGYQITVCDMTPWLEPGIHAAVHQDRIYDPRFIRVEINTSVEADAFVRQNANDAIFLPMFNLYYEVRKAYSLLTKYNVSFGYVNCLLNEINAFMPVSGGKELSLVQRLHPEHLKKAFYNRIVRKLLHYKPADFIAFGYDSGESLYWDQCACDPGVTRKIYTHTYDYERFLQLPGYDNGGKKYVVFMDQFFPFHPDFSVKLGIYEDPAVYLGYLNDCFRVIREKYDVDIIIAAHPRADYRDRGDVFPGCKIVYGMSAELVKNAEAVIAHYSCSISFAAMAMKPLLLLNPPVFHKYPLIQDVLHSYAQFLGVKPVVSVEEVGQADLSYVNKGAYGDFLSRSIKCTDAEDALLWSTIFPKH